MQKNCIHKKKKAIFIPIFFLNLHLPERLWNYAWKKYEFYWISDALKAQELIFGITTST